MLEFLKRNKAPKVGKIPPSYLSSMAEHLSQTNVIENDLYIKYNVKRGLRNANGTGVVVGLTRIGEVVGYKTDEQNNKVPVPGELYYRGYEIKELVTNYQKENRFGFEEVTFLLMFGELPTKDELTEFKRLIAEKRELPKDFARDMILTTPSKNIMNKLSRSVLGLYCYDENPDSVSVENILLQSINLIGRFPALVAYAYQAKTAAFDNKSLVLHQPLPELSTAENLLRMTRDDGLYTDFEAKVLDTCLIIHTEHGGGNNSTFTTHLISSSGTDTYSVISAAIGSLKGPLHGGANISVIGMLEDLKEKVADPTDTNQLDEYIRKLLMKEAYDNKGLVYGMGHAIYTISDPRAVILKEMARDLAKAKGLEDEFNICEYIENNTPRIYEEIHGQKKTMCANVDLYSGFVYGALNIPMDIATPLFAIARLSGWLAHRLEEMIAGRKLMRPGYVCVQDHKDYIPYLERKALGTTRAQKRAQKEAKRRATMDLSNLAELVEQREKDISNGKL